MTLLEAVIAFVILSVVGVVCLDQARGASQLQRSSAEWTRAIARGESALAEAIASAAPPSERADPAGEPAVRIQRRPWEAGLDIIEVSVPLGNGRTYEMARLVPSPAIGASVPR